MYEISQRRPFITQHILPNAQGRERECHSHPYQVELTLLGERLDGNGYLVDLDEINAALDALIDYFQDRTLNDLPEFEGVNPSLENFCRIFWQKYVSSIDIANLSEVKVKIWEYDSAYASFTQRV